LSDVLTDRKVPDGGVASPWELSPQQARVPSVLIPHGAEKPMLMEVKVPERGGSVPLRPQHARVPSGLIPHMAPELPVLTAIKLPAGGSPM
jgi:hypothetical protein